MTFRPDLVATFNEVSVTREQMTTALAVVERALPHLNITSPFAGDREEDFRAFKKSVEDNFPNFDNVSAEDRAATAEVYKKLGVSATPLQTVNAIPVKVFENGLMHAVMDNNKFDSDFNGYFNPLKAQFAKIVEDSIPEVKRFVEVTGYSTAALATGKGEFAP